MKTSSLLRRTVALVLTGLLATVSLPAADETGDAAVIAGMKQRLIEVQKQIIASADPAEQARLQKSLRAIMEEALPKLSARGRTPMLVSLRLVQPIQDAGSAYMQMVADYAASPQSDLTKITSHEDIQARVAHLNRLDTANTGLLNLLNNFETDAARILKEEKVSAAETEGFLAGLSRGFGRQIGPLKAIRNLDTRMYALLTSAMMHLDQHWGKWKNTPEGRLAWTDEKLEQQLVTMLEEIRVLAERQSAAQQALAARL
jgi:hypothetical protein